MSIKHAVRGCRRRWVLVGALLFLLACGSTRSASIDGWVDRIEGDHAVIIQERGTDLDEWVERVVPLADLPEGVCEGDYVARGAIDREATAAMRQRIIALQRQLLEASSR
jgi:hypothetical protein